jgi:hypothetical protein
MKLFCLSPPDTLLRAMAADIRENSGSNLGDAWVLLLNEMTPVRREGMTIKLSADVRDMPISRTDCDAQMPARLKELRDSVVTAIEAKKVLLKPDTELCGLEGLGC